MRVFEGSEEVEVVVEEGEERERREEEKRVERWMPSMAPTISSWFVEGSSMKFRNLRTLSTLNLLCNVFVLSSCLSF